MKIAITGHTSGIGKGLYDYYIKDNDLFGYSRSNGFDLSDREQLDRCIDSIIGHDVDIAILNAYTGSSQLNMLTALNNKWSMDINKTVVIISSNGSDYRPNFNPRYSIDKASLDRAVFEYTQNRSWRLINIRPGYTDTNMVKHINAKKMQVDRVVDAVVWAINAPKDSVIQSITIIPRPHYV